MIDTLGGGTHRPHADEDHVRFSQRPHLLVAKDDEVDSEKFRIGGDFEIS